jgi:RNA polymerase sigma factor (sigma-70 family)
MDVIAATLTPTTDARTFEGVDRAHQRDVLRYAALMLGDLDEAADATAETFTRAFAAWREGRGPTGRPLPWLLVIARRLIVDRWRRRRLVRWLPLVHGEAVAGRRAEEADAGDVWLWLSQLSVVLPERQREVLFLRDRRDLSEEEIGEVMGLSASGVRSLVARAIQGIREHPELSR